MRYMIRTPTHRLGMKLPCPPAEHRSPRGIAGSFAQLESSAKEIGPSEAAIMADLRYDRLRLRHGASLPEWAYDQ
jgi:hypothetical protein